ncbi:MAG: alpha/beta fold hydrolase [Bacteroidota bacterium]
MRKRLYLLLVIWLSGAVIGFAQNTSTFKSVFKKSKKTTHKIPKGQDYTFGYLEVPENRKLTEGRTIKIPVYIFKSRSDNPKPDPIIYTVGGPGSSTMPSAPYMNYYKYLDDRDFILVEQRGNYYAQPHLDCPEWSEAQYLSNLPDFDVNQTDSLLAEAAQSCRDRLTKNGIDLNGYNTNEIAADINDLVDVLDIESYNLLTISYSTKIAQVLMRDYPEKIRSVVMDSALPLEVSYDEESVAHLLSAVNQLLSDCASDESCNRAFPNLRKRFFEYLTVKTKEPLAVQVEHPKTGNLETFYLKGADLITVFTAAATSNVANVPFEINRLLEGDLTEVKERLLGLFEQPGNGAGLGMRLSVWCAEEYPFSNQATIAAETTKYPQVQGLSPAVFEEEVCEIWRIEKVADIENEAITSDIPTLFINGEYDNETPVKWATAMIPNFENSHHLIFKGWKHTPTTNWSNQCAMQVANDFFNDPTSKPMPDCFGEIGGLVFRTK